jgi:diadenosine tetraphosphate (Ap4A) HIT family hydrolase
MFCVIHSCLTLSFTRVKWAIMPEQDLVIQGGTIIRPGFFRHPDGSGVAYARKVANTTPDTCVFCPELTQTIIDTGTHFTVIKANPAYAHFDAQRVAEHNLLLPNDHVTSLHQLGQRALREINEYIQDRAAWLRDNSGLTLQDYTRRAGNPSKSVEHLHTHLFELAPEPVEEFAFNMQSGVTALKFCALSREQLEMLRQK